MTITQPGDMIESDSPVKLIWITPEAEKVIAYCARVSNPEGQANDKIENLIRYCAKNKHWSIFEMANMTVEINTTLDIAPQILRHKSLCFQQFSRRYCDADLGYSVSEARAPHPKNRQLTLEEGVHPHVKAEWQRRQIVNLEKDWEDYQWALKNGIGKECARTVLGGGFHTRMYANGTIRSWIHYLQTRTSEDTQKEHRLIALSIKKIFELNLPIIYNSVFSEEQQ